MPRPKRTVGLPGHLKEFDVHLPVPAAKKKKTQHSEAAAELDSSILPYIRKLFALPYLPLEEIAGAFYRLASSATEELRPLVDYLEDTWISGHQSYSKPASWCVFGRAIRTNNDVEGWHHRLNKHAGRAQLPFYMLLPLLYKEAGLIPYQQRLVSENQLRRYRRRKTTETQALLGQLWEDYHTQKLSVKQLLHKVSLLDSVAPVLPSLPPSVPRLPSVDNAVVWETVAHWKRLFFIKVFFTIPSIFISYFSSIFTIFLIFFLDWYWLLWIHIQIKLLWTVLLYCTNKLFNLKKKYIYILSWFFPSSIHSHHIHQ